MGVGFATFSLWCKDLTTRAAGCCGMKQERQYICERLFVLFPLRQLNKITRTFPQTWQTSIVPVGPCTPAREGRHKGTKSWLSMRTLRWVQVIHALNSVKQWLDSSDGARQAAHVLNASLPGCTQLIAALMPPAGCSGPSAETLRRPVHRTAKECNRVHDSLARG